LFPVSDCPRVDNVGSSASLSLLNWPHVHGSTFLIFFFYHQQSHNTIYLATYICMYSYYKSTWTSIPLN
jgi:hypothetical protein